MVDSDSIPRIGQIVRILRGRDAEKLAVIVGLEDNRFVWIADGDKRKFDSPKKKNLSHVQSFDYISPEVHESIDQTGRVTNGKLRFAVNKFRDLMEAQIEKGE